VEIELFDAGANRRLAAAVDSKGSGPFDAHGASPLVEAGAAFRDWAERIAVRVAAMRSFDRQQR
jgi:hypothetical protein